ncbi:MAG: hydroxyacid dehydrogenase [Bacteroidetes bacterium]|nr:hydroxyacid dehydrogenase [Bacteroidota bacterium]MBV6462190.1 Hydroxypyruvate reductase [Flavobacteriales bacterium]WKZ75960.1 MAG: NAD(P)-dependent oxidoreductase [Vicingaceae bacterium]MCL4816904.1 hypothetical protein [Flavobacteriales bacterium]NOG96155.1 hydroxyacid dehydrogenase [Bacteroidota bacterium]
MSKSPILTTTSSFSYTTENIIQNPFKRKLTEKELIELLKKYNPEILIAGVEPITEKAMNASPNLKVIARVGVGLDNVDLIAAQKKNIEVLNTPDAVTAPVAELTLGLLLSLLRKIYTSHASILQHKWDRPMGMLLKGKTVGIMGAGRIGKYVANLVKAFGADVLIYDPFSSIHSYSIENNIETFASKADIITLHMPLTNENKEILNEKFFSMLKRGCYIVNTSRGELVNENDLYNALVSGKISGAALDVYNKEPYTGKLTELENVLLTAHIGSYAKEARYEMEKQAYEDAINYLKKIQK